MRTLAICICLTAAAIPCISQESDSEKKLSAIGGKITNALTGEPLRKAAVSLSPMPGANVGTPPQALSATTDAEGKFLFENLQPGRYMLSADKTGFGRQQYGTNPGSQLSPGTQLNLGAGETLKSLEFKMTPQAVITGRVVDEDGEPVNLAMIQALRQTSFSRSPMGMTGGSTNDIGEFRIANLAPGKYILRADYRGSTEPARGVSQEKGAPRFGYVPTYYPGGTDINSVAPFEVRAGQELTGVQIQLQKARVYQVSGKLIGVPSSSGRLNVSLQPQRRPGSGGSFVYVSGAGGSVKPDGTFSFPSVQSGTYHLTVMNYDTGRPVMLGKTLVTVSNQDVENVVVQTGSPLTVTGTLIREGESQDKLSAQIMMQSTEGIGFFGMPARTDETGAFRLESVPRDKLNVLVMGIPGDLYVSSIRAGSVDVIANGLDLTNAESAPALEVRVSPNGATVEGTVLNGDKPATGAIVTLVPQPFRPDVPSMFQKISNTDQTGRFQIRGVAPGEYRAYALAEYVPLQNMDPAELKLLEPNSVSVRLKEKGREQVELKLITAPPK